jgi:tetratricopeptide (TPR) repeat protein
VVGVVVIDTPGFAHRVLTAVPVSTVLADDEARRLLDAHSYGDSVELDDLLEPRSRISAPRSPAQLLRAEQEAIRFVGRDAELAMLTDWAVAPGKLGVRLVTGPGGRGKTRLAQELTHRLARDPGWVTGVLESPAKTHRDIARILETTTDLRLLLMVDYAESRVEQVCDILCAADRAMDAPHLRLLLLARDSGDWWENDLLLRHGELEDICEHIALPELHPFGERTDQFYKCAREFAKRLPEIVPEVDWARRLEAVTPPDLTEPGYGDPLSIQLASMLALLGEDGASSLASLETRLIRHEKAYWQYVLEVRGIALESHVRDQAVAAATLFSVAGRQAALRLLGRVPELTAPGPVATWLAELYPHAKHYWGPLQPDRLGEHHVGDVSSRSPEFLRALFSEASMEEAEAALVVIGRAMAHQTHLEAQVRTLVEEGRPGMAEAVRGAARFVPNPRLFLRGLGQRATVDPDAYTPVHESTQWMGPGQDSDHATLETRAGELRAWIDERVAAEDPVAVQLLLELVDNRTRAKDLSGALTTVQEAVSAAYRWGDQLQIAQALLARSGVEADAGLLERALASSQESTDTLERLAAATPDRVEVAELLGRSMSNSAALMQRAGRNDEALKHSSQALRQLAGVQAWYADPHVRLRAEVTHASIAASLSQFAEARATLEKTLAELDRLHELQPALAVETLALRAAARSNLGACLDEMGEHALAMPVLGQAIDDYSTLGDPAFAPEIARTAITLAELAAREGDLETAVEAARRTVTEISRWHLAEDSSTETGLRDSLLTRASTILATWSSG